MEPNEQRNSTGVALKVVFFLSLLLVSMDTFEVIYSYNHLNQNGKSLDRNFFEDCIKYHVIGQIFFTLFATFAGMSACFMSAGLLINYEFFATKALDTFLYWNYLIFGPYLLSSCVLAYFYLNEVIYNCDPKDVTRKYLNFSTLMALIICFVISTLITFTYSFLNTIQHLISSVRFNSEGNRVIGRLFWDYVIHRESEVAPNQSNMNLNNIIPPSLINRQEEPEIRNPQEEPLL